MPDPAWLTVTRGGAPLVVTIPHAGTDIPDAIAGDLVSPWLARKDCDWHVGRLYEFAADLGATVIRTAISRTVIDVNRDPDGTSLYPGQHTTGLCPTTTFDGEPLYRDGRGPHVEERRQRWFFPYHDAVAAELLRLREAHPTVVLYDCHSIRSVVPRLFDGRLPEFSIGTNSGASCAPALAARIERLCDATGRPRATDGRFKGGYITRHYGRPEDAGIHAVQMELACRAYLREPDGAVDETNWPPPYDLDLAEPLRTAVTAILKSCIGFALSQSDPY